jgi:hypothetical protein
MVRKPRPADMPPGVVRRDEVYTLDELERRLRVTGWTLREAFRAGLRSVRLERVKLVRGADFDDFLAEEAKRQGQEREDRKGG